MPGTQTYVPLHAHVRGLGPSPTVAINERCDQLRAQGRVVYKLGLGQSPFPVPNIVVEALRAHATRKEYMPVKGLPELRAAVADYHRRRSGIGSEAEDVLIGPGSKELMYLLQVVYDGELIIPTPAWVSYAPQAQIVGRRVSFLPASAEDEYRLTPDMLDEHCRRVPDLPRILILNYPSNPTGVSFEDAELQAIAGVARRHKVIVLSDEIYGELHHRGQHVSIGRHYPEGTIISSGLSKWCGAGGWRLGTFTLPRSMRWLLDAMAAVGSETFTSTSAPIQCAAVSAFKVGPELEKYLADGRRVLAAIARVLIARLESAGVSVPRVDGGFYLFPNFGAARGMSGSPELCERVLDETGVAMLPGSVFGRDEAELTARIAYVDFDGGKALAGAAAVSGELSDEFVHTHCGQMVEAIDAVCRWVRR